MSPAKRFCGVSALVLLAPLFGCVSNLEPLNVTEFLPVGVQGGACSVSASSTEGLAQGLLDTNLPNMLATQFPMATLQPGYMVGVKVESNLLLNNLQPNIALQSNPNAVRTDTHTAMLNSVTAKYQFTALDGTSVPIKDRTFPVSAIVPTGQFATFPVQILSGADGKLLGTHEGTLVVQLTFSGELQDGGSVSTTPANFTVSVCNGCTAPPTCAMGQALALACGSEAAAQPDALACVASGTGG